MPLKTEPMEEPSLNLTSMIDVVMLLLIFFLVATRFSKDESQYEVNLPTVRSAQPLTSLPDEIVVSITQKGEILIKDEMVTPLELEQRLIAAQKNYADQVVLIRGDGLGLYQPVMDVMAACHQAHIKQMKLANRPASEN
jgi:biopolymer transport protein ExbD